VLWWLYQINKIYVCFFQGQCTKLFCPIGQFAFEGGCRANLYTTDGYGVEVFLKISLSKEISMTESMRLTEIVLKIVDTCGVCSFRLIAIPKKKCVFYVNLILHTSDRCSENDIITALQNIEKVYAARKQIVNTVNGTSVVTLNVAVSDDVNETYRWYRIHDNYRCNVMARLNQKYACPYILENDNATEMYAANGIEMDDIADTVTSSDETKMYRVCLSDIAIKNAATKTCMKFNLVIAGALVLLKGLC